MKRTLRLNIGIDGEGNYKVVSDEPESGLTALIVAGNIYKQDDAKFNKKIGLEVMSWLTMWADEIAESEEE